jgi:hypothetical protein
MELPIAARSVADQREQAVEGKCDRGSVVVVRCNATGQIFNLTCPSWASRWNITCPHVVPVSACLCWDGQKWSGDGIVVVNTSGPEVHCTSTHMTNYLGIVGHSLASVEATMPTYEKIELQDLQRVSLLIMFLVVANVFATFVLLRDCGI